MKPEQYIAGCQRIAQCLQLLVDVPLDDMLATVDSMQHIGDIEHKELYQQRVGLLAKDRAAIEAAAPLRRLARQIVERSLAARQSEGQTEDPPAADPESAPEEP